MTGLTLAGTSTAWKMDPDDTPKTLAPAQIIAGRQSQSDTCLDYVLLLNALRIGVPGLANAVNLALDCCVLHLR